jgi:hypothetical protein
MLGTLHIIPPSTKILHRIIQLDQVPTTERLSNAVDGPLKLVEGFDTILRGGEIEPCLAFRSNQECSSHNTWANLLWLQALVRREGFSSTKTPHSLTGSIVVLWGDLEFLKTLDPLLAHLHP